MSIENTSVDDLQSVFMDGIAKAAAQHQTAPSPPDITIPAMLPILPLRNTVLFPGVIIPVNVGRPKSIRLLEDLGDSKLVCFTSQIASDIDEPDATDLFTIGTVGMVLKVLKMPDASRSIIVQGIGRVRLKTFMQKEPYFVAEIEPLAESVTEGIEIDAYVRTIKMLSAKIIDISPNLPNEASYAVQNIDSPMFLVHFITSNLNINAADKQSLLEIPSLNRRAEKLIEFLNREIQVLELTKQIQTKVKLDMDKAQREYFLRQQLKTIQTELGEFDLQMSDVAKLRETLAKKKLNVDVLKATEREIDKLSRIPSASPDYGVTRNYIDLILSLPWDEYSQDSLNLREAERILNEDHYGLEKIKTRILEYLAVLKLKANMKAPILCFFGPPGVGKTSLGKSIARALNRKFVRISLGGVRDEAEIRGHRRTYIGAMPGRIIQGLNKAGVSNPVFMLDEIDKLGSDFRGDPSSALLEVLDPAQNGTFSDHYLEQPYDLSRVIFIATANSLDTIPLALRDRMEIIQITGYTEFEKIHIANEYLIPRQLEEHGLTKENLAITPEALSRMINNYTREAGVRSLEREIGGVCRSVAKDVALADLPTEIQITVKAESLKKYLGLPKHFPDSAERIDVPGVAVGLAWTPVGGDILFIESTVVKGSGRLTLTGQLGDVMKESAQAALSYLKASADYFRIPDEAFKHWDVHLHIPQGAIPKDGPSAGVTMLVSLASIYTQRKVRSGVAMTGEITLRGHVLPVGGIKEKILAAKRAGITEILMPEKNRNDVEDVSADALTGMSFRYFSDMDELINAALEPHEYTDAFDKFNRDAEEAAAKAADPVPADESENFKPKSQIAAKGDSMHKLV
jgi:ATP-dependent Lon protease